MLAVSSRKETEKPGEPSRSANHKDERALGTRKDNGFPIDWNCQHSMADDYTALKGRRNSPLR